jgi:hypothetical protein
MTSSSGDRQCAVRFSPPFLQRWRSLFSWARTEEPPPEPVIDHRAELIENLQRLQSIFGTEKGAQLAIQCDDLEAALVDEIRLLQRLVELRDAQISEMNERLWVLEDDP